MLHSGAHAIAPLCYTVVGVVAIHHTFQLGTSIAVGRLQAALSGQLLSFLTAPITTFFAEKYVSQKHSVVGRVDVFGERYLGIHVIDSNFRVSMFADDFVD